MGVCFFIFFPLRSIRYYSANNGIESNVSDEDKPLAAMLIPSWKHIHLFAQVLDYFCGIKTHSLSAVLAADIAFLKVFGVIVVDSMAVWTS